MTPGMFIRLVLASGTFIKPVLTSGMFIRCKLTSGMFIRSVMTPGMFTDLYWHQVYNKNAALYWVRQGIFQTSFHRTLWHLFCVSLIDPQPQFFFCRDKWPALFFITSSKKPYNLSNVHQKNAVQLLFLWRVCFCIVNVIKPASIICSWDSMEQLSIAQFRLQFSNCKNFCNSQMIKEHLVQKYL